MKTYVFIDWSSGEGRHVAQLELADDAAALAYLADHLGANHTCEEVYPAGNREITP